MKYIILFFLLFAIFSVKSQENQELRFRGKILNYQAETLSDVHIIIQTSLHITKSKEDGSFYFLCQINDTILFSAVGFKIKKFIIPNEIENNELTKNIILISDTVLLSEVIVPSWTNYEEAKQHFLSLELNRENEIDLHIDMPLLMSGGGNGISLGSPISALYNKFSDREESKRKLVKLLKSDQIRAKKYNEKIVADIINSNDKKLIKRLIIYCDLSDKFLETASEYEITEAILACYKQLK